MSKVLLLLSSEPAYIKDRLTQDLRYHYIYIAVFYSFILLSMDQVFCTITCPFG